MIECRVLRLIDDNLDGEKIDHYVSFFAILINIDAFEQTILEDGTELVLAQVGNEIYHVEMDYKTFRQRYLGFRRGLNFN